MSLPDTIFILLGALVLFGPKKLPELARQVGKIMGELRRASNEFKFQMEEELRASEESTRRQAATAAHSTPAPVMTLQAPATGEPVANRISARAADAATPADPALTVDPLPATDPLPGPAEQRAAAEAANHA